MKRIAAVLGLAVLALAGVLLVRTWTAFPERRIDVAPSTLEVDADRAIRHLAEAVRIRTISASGDAPFHEFHAWLKRSYARVHGTLELETFGLSLLYRWRGSEPSLAPVLLMAHQDVVGVEPGTEKDWTHPPFQGVVADEFVWGRGAIDMKGALVGIFEAMETLLEQGHEPRRTILVALGHDEEIGGSGNRAIAEALRQRGVRMHWVLDEGPFILRTMRGVPRPVAIIGIAEKGSVKLELVARGNTGHASAPPAHTAVARLARAIDRLNGSPSPYRLEGPTRTMLEHLAPHMTFRHRVALANLWLLEGRVIAAMSERAMGRAVLRTTAACTIFQGGSQANALPGRARAVVDFRILPGESIESTIDATRRAIDDDQVDIRAQKGGLQSEPSRLSRVAAPGYEAVERAILATFPEVIVAPGLLTAATDSRHYAGLAEDIYRFLPAILDLEDVTRVHGTDERLSASSISGYVRFYASVLVGADK